MKKRIKGKKKTKFAFSHVTAMHQDYGFRLKFLFLAYIIK